MEIEYSIMKLRPKKRLNRLSFGEREVLFFRVNRNFYLEYAPWIEFGDISCEQMLNQIRVTKELPLFLLKTLKLEESNNIDHKKFKNHKFGVGDQAYSRKIKFNGSFEDLKKDLFKSGGTFRIDFNNGSSVQALSSFLKSNSRELNERIEFLEDPFTLNGESEKFILDYGIKIAADRNQFFHPLHAFNIYKPNIEYNDNTFDYSIFSSYMGSDLGRYHCYLHLMSYGNLDLIHGINTPDLFDDQVCLFKDEGECNLSLNTTSIDIIYKKLEKLEWINLT